MAATRTLICVAATTCIFAACSKEQPSVQAASPSPPPVSAPLPPRPTEAERFANAVVDIGGRRSNDAVKITLAGDRFSPGQGDFQPGDKVDAIATVMKDHPQARVQIEGFTDSRGSDAVNMRLSAERAAAVKRALEERGVDGSRIETAGRGSAQPVASNDTVDGRSQNRRVELTFVPRPQDQLVPAVASAPN